jgi:hypothetical protein
MASGGLLPPVVYNSLAEIHHAYTTTPWRLFAEARNTRRED